MQTLRYIILFLSLLYVTIYIPFFSVTYFPSWYNFSCQWNERCHYFGLEESANCIDQLVSFFRHTGELTHNRWSQKEKLHLADVREMFDRLAFTALLAVALLLFTIKQSPVRWFAIANIIIIISFFSIFPFFKYLWRDIFHGILFDNTYWRNNPMDASYFILPVQFFKYTTILIICAAVVINVLLFVVTGIIRKS